MAQTILKTISQQINMTKWEKFIWTYYHCMSKTIKYGWRIFAWNNCVGVRTTILFGQSLRSPVLDMNFIRIFGWLWLWVSICSYLFSTVSDNFVVKIHQIKFAVKLHRADAWVRKWHKNRHHAIALWLSPPRRARCSPASGRRGHRRMVTSRCAPTPGLGCPRWDAGTWLTKCSRHRAYRMVARWPAAELLRWGGCSDARADQPQPICRG